MSNPGSRCSLEMRSLTSWSGIVSANRQGEGSYGLTINRNVEFCAALVTGDSTPPIESAGEKFGTAIDVRLWRGCDLFGNSVLVDSGFSIAVFC